MVDRMANIAGTDGADTIDGTGNADQIDGKRGKDVIHGLGGDDTISGGTGDDLLYGDDGNDVLDALFGNDILYGGEGNDKLYGSSEVPADYAGADLELPAGFQQVSYLYGGAGNDTLYGELTYGAVNTGARTTYMIGGIGNDTYYARYADQLTIVENAGEGTDQIVFMYRETPGSGSVFYMPANVEQFFGVLGTQTVNGVKSSGTVVGNALDNFIVTSAELGGVKITTGNMTILAGAGNDSVESDAGNDLIYGEAGDDYLSGGTGSDVLIGGDGNDNLDTGYFASDTPFADALYGGTGDDVYGIDHPGDVVFENPGEGRDLALVRIQNGGWYAYADIEMIWANSDTLTFLVGNASDNDIRGGTAGELLLGGGGGDLILGNDGSDSLYGEAGDDSLNGGDGVDYLFGGAGKDSLNGGNGSDALYGEDGDDSLSGGYRDFSTDILIGGEGNDTLDGASGLGDYDLMDGGAGNDIYYVDTPADVTYEAVGGGTDTVYADITGTGYQLYANVENLWVRGATAYGVGNELDNMIDATQASSGNNPTLLGGAGNDVLRGGSGANGLYGEDGNDELYGGQGDDVLIGGDGDDKIYGEAGSDFMVGGAGKDVFYVGTYGLDLDYILDFQHAIDRIAFSTSYFDFATLKAQFTQQGADTLIEYSTSRYLVLKNIDKNILTGADFGFAGSDAAVAFGGGDAAGHVAMYMPTGQEFCLM